MTTAIVHHSIFEKHNTGFGHPETSQRYRVILDTLREDEDLWKSLKEITPEKAPRGLVQAAHTKEHFRRVEEAFGNGLDRLDADTVISMQSFDAALYAAGAACAAVDAVMRGEGKNAFAAVRPPGHHATAEHSMGFCIFNNAAIAALYAKNNYREIDRIAILDWDVHHGNGTQGIFYSEPKVFYFSMHQYPWYPGTGSRGETGQGRGLGFTLNVPVKAFTKADEQVRMFESAIEDISRAMKPDLVIISAGFDAHISDPLGQLQLEDSDFVRMTQAVKQWADEICGGRIISLLEGGYNLETLGETARNHVRELNRA